MSVRVQPTNEAISATDYKLYNRGPFEQVVFLRSGPGVYKVKILIKDAVENVLYVAAYFYVTNVSPYNFLNLMPTVSVTSLDPAIRDKALEVTAPFGTDGEKARAIHDWIVRTLRYGGAPDAQNSDTVFRTHEGVCQGYCCLAAAMFRSIGFPAKYIHGYVRGSTNEPWPDEITHAWNEVYYDGEWNIMDVTWDDPLIGENNDYPDGYNLRTNWFEPSLEYFYTRHTNGNETDYRSDRPGPIE
jgi:transglutaminase-like putative cysteine protease